MLASGNVVNKAVVDVNVSGAAGLATSTADNNEGEAKCDEHSPSSTTAAVVNLGAGKLISAEIALGREGSHNDGAEPEKTNLINGSAIGECCRLSQQIVLTNDNRSRTVGLLYDGGSTNTVVSPEENDLVTESWVLDESFDLVTQGHTQEMSLIRDQFQTENGFCFQAVRLASSGEEIMYKLIEIPERFQRQYGMSEVYSVQTAGHAVVAGIDMAMNFPDILEIDSESGVGVFRSRIDGQVLPFTTGRENSYCQNYREPDPPRPPPTFST